MNIATCIMYIVCFLILHHLSLTISDHCCQLAWFLNFNYPAGYLVAASARGSTGIAFEPEMRTVEPGPEGMVGDS